MPEKSRARAACGQRLAAGVKFVEPQVYFDGLADFPTKVLELSNMLGMMADFLVAYL